MRRFAVIVAAVLPFLLLVAQPASAVNKCLVWVWIDGWRCAIGI